jgi:hypothetical protein
MGKSSTFLIAIALAAPHLSVAAAPADVAAPVATPQERAAAVRFEANHGQTDSRVRYLARGPGYTLFLTDAETVLALAGPDKKRSALRMRMAGADPRAGLTAEGRLPGVSNYFLGDDPSRWRTDVESYARVRHEAVYPGVDVVYYGAGGQLEYDFVVAPGADPGRIALDWEGAESAEVDASGDLVLKVAGGEVRQSAPALYQEDGGERRAVAGAWADYGGGRVGLRVGAYDPARPLVVDPLLTYSTFLGGHAGDSAYAVAVDSAGLAYITGLTLSTDFPTWMPYDGTNDGGAEVPEDVFVSKMSVYGNLLVYSTYLGGTGDESGGSIAVDASGSAYVTGTTGGGFPTVNAYDATHNGSSDVFVTKLNPAGNALVYSTYLGGTAIDDGAAIAIDASGSAYVSGSTWSASFPTASAFDATYNGGIDAFVAKLSPVGNSLLYSTFLGGSGFEQAAGIAVDAGGAAYVTGPVESPGFPTANAFDAVFSGERDAFVAKLSAAGNALGYSTFLGGSGSELARGIAVDGDGAAYVVGATSSADFPIAAAFDNAFGGVADAFVTKLSPAGNALVYSTYLGGTNDDVAWAVAVDVTRSAYVTGRTGSTEFPMRNATDSTYNGQFDAFVTKFTEAGSTLAYSTYVGGAEIDDGLGIAVSASGAAYVSGSTFSIDFPTANPYTLFYSDLGDAFVLKLDSGAGADGPGAFVPGSSAWFLRNTTSPGPADYTFSFGPPGSGWRPLTGDWDGDTDDSPGLYDPATGAFFLKHASASGAADITFTFGAAGAGLVPLAGDWNGDGIDTVGLYAPSTGAFFLKNSNAPGPADLVFTFGAPGLVPLAGDWDGDRRATVGVYNPGAGVFFLKNLNEAGPADVTVGFGPTGVTPLTGDWNGDGVATVGVYVGATGTFFVRNTNTPGAADAAFAYGPPGATPLVGDWDGF